MISRERLNVLQICHDYEGPFRAVCRQYTHAFEDHNVTTAYLRGAKDDDVARDTGGDRVIFLEQGPLKGLKLAPLLSVARLFREQRFDVVIAHRYKPIYIAGIMSWFFPIKLLLGVVHEHGVFRRMTRALLLTFWCRNIQVVAVSETVRRDVLKDVPALGPAGRVHTLNNAIDTEIRHEFIPRTEAREALGIPSGVFCFGSVGRLVAKKDYEVLVEGFGLAQLKDSVLVMIGSGPREEELRSRVTEMNLSDRVVFTGRIDRAWRYLNAFDVFVMTSGDREAFGIVLLEAMLAGLPIITSDAEGPAEVVGETGILFRTGNAADLADRMQAARNDGAALEASGKGGHRRVMASFSMKAFSERLWKLPWMRGLMQDQAR